ncbi:MAG: prolyl oligopeptidase family serine peptidase [Salinivirgaceae bacterium]|nr:prolyl oligopeptidase family serine peptidase [Salinivirgaceae bacterium]
MNKITWLFVIFAFLMSCNTKKEKIDIPPYPETKKGDVVDEYFGHKVPDPYRWLENDTSKATADWVAAQNKVTFGYLDQIPFRDAIKNRLTEIWDYPRISAPFKKGSYYYVFKNDGLQNQSVAYIKESLEDEGKVILDPNQLSDDGTVSLAAFAPSENGKYLAYAISRGGSDWREIYVKNIETGEMLDDHIVWAKFSGITWYKNGFFYSRYPEPKEGDKLKGVNENNKVYYHEIGTSQKEDNLVYEDTKNPKWGFGVDVTEDEKYLVIYVTESTSGNALYFKELGVPGAKMHKMITSFENDYSLLDHVNGKFLVQTNDGASRYRIMEVDPKKYEMANWKEFIAEEEGVIRGVSFVGGKLIINYMRDARSQVEIFNLKGKHMQSLDRDIVGTISGFAGKREHKETFYTVTSFTTPSTVYRYDVENNKSELYRRSKIDFDASKYEAKQIFYESKDGTKVPMFIVHKKGLELNGNHPTLLYGYGGFNVSLTPSFSITRLIWLENDGVVAIPNIRGGGEYGDDWHKAGTVMKKQNVFDDFIAAADYLIEKKYTSSKKLTIQGGSNGGLLIGAVANQRPELFAVAFPAVGVMDMLRYHKFTIGRYWATDYGTSEDSEEMFKYLLKYSPVHSIKEGTKYPAVMVTTADHDDRVVPAHSFKYIATLQDTYKGENPVLIRIEAKAGHGAGKPTDKVIQEYADLWSFAFYNMGVKPKYGEK